MEQTTPNTAPGPRIKSGVTLWQAGVTWVKSGMTKEPGVRRSPV